MSTIAHVGTSHHADSRAAASDGWIHEIDRAPAWNLLDDCHTTSEERAR